MLYDPAWNLRWSNHLARTKETLFKFAVLAGAEARLAGEDCSSG
jgi:hypothetical protein